MRSQRLVIKDVNLWLYWDKVTAWSNDARDTPREVAAHRTIREPPPDADPADEDCRYILPYRGSRLEKRWKCFRIASARADTGSLHGLAACFAPRDTDFR